MGTCKDCIHNELCNIHGYIDADECAVFKNEADFVEVVRCKDCKCCEHIYPVKKIGKEAIKFIILIRGWLMWSMRKLKNGLSKAEI